MAVVAAAAGKRPQQQNSTSAPACHATAYFLNPFFSLLRQYLRVLRYEGSCCAGCAWVWDEVAHAAVLSAAVESSRKRDKGRSVDMTKGVYSTLMFTREQERTKPTTRTVG